MSKFTLSSLCIAGLIAMTPGISAQPSGAVTSSKGAILTGGETVVTTSVGDQYDPHLSGNIVVFTDVIISKFMRKKHLT